MRQAHTGREESERADAPPRTNQRARGHAETPCLALAPMRTIHTPRRPRAGGSGMPVALLATRL